MGREPERSDDQDRLVLVHLLLILLDWLLRGGALG